VISVAAQVSLNAWLLGNSRPTGGRFVNAQPNYSPLTRQCLAQARGALEAYLIAFTADTVNAADIDVLDSSSWRNQQRR